MPCLPRQETAERLQKHPPHNPNGIKLGRDKEASVFCDTMWHFPSGERFIMRIDDGLVDNDTGRNFICVFACDTALLWENTGFLLCLCLRRTYHENPFEGISHSEVDGHVLGDAEADLRLDQVIVCCIFLWKKGKKLQGLLHALVLVW